MAQQYVQVEVLLMTGTSFLAGNWVPRDDDPGSQGLSDMEKLQAGRLQLLTEEDFLIPIPGVQHPCKLHEQQETCFREPILLP